MRYIVSAYPVAFPEKEEVVRFRFAMTGPCCMGYQSFSTNPAPIRLEEAL